MKKEFKLGDKVYCPIFGNQVYTLLENQSTLYNFKIELNNTVFIFTDKGEYHALSKTPSLFHATKTNKELLEKLYAIEFGEPPMTNCEIIAELLTQHRYVTCWVSNEERNPNKSDAWSFVYGIDDYHHQMYDSVVGKWEYATPFDAKTGKRIIGVRNGVAVLEGSND